MTKVYLFDWGDTLMVDFPDEQGKMCNWTKVQAVDGAEDVLSQLFKSHKIFVATNAADSTELDIKVAFERVNLTQYISGYFCKSNLGVGKGTPSFFSKIMQSLNLEPSSIIMVGDSLEKDIKPAIMAGINAIWFNPSQTKSGFNKGYRQIKCLREICT
ncbi:TPA: HAD hydrolase-like protein [Vibrio parahaemolyticus]|nr:HAD hydrolase-like protein [Vibrio parahaemolyticus]